MIRILLAEDDVDLGDLQRTFLEALGYDVTVVEDGSAARACLSQGPGDYAALITDAQMPSMTGLELIQWVRSQDQIGDLPILLTSGSQADGEVAALLDERTCFGAKPMGLETIASLMNKLVGRPETSGIKRP